MSNEPPDLIVKLKNTELYLIRSHQYSSPLGLMENYSYTWTESPLIAYRFGSIEDAEKAAEKAIPKGYYTIRRLLPYTEHAVAEYTPHVWKPVGMGIEKVRTEPARQCWLRRMFCERSK